MNSNKKTKFSLGSTKVQITVLILSLIILSPQVIRLINGDYSFKNVDFSLFGLATLLFSANYLLASLVYIFLTYKKLPFFRTILVQVASGFANKITPAGLGNMGINTLYLWRSARLSKTDSATIASANNLIGFIGYNLLFWLLILGGWAKSESAPPLSGFVLVSLGVGMGISVGYLVIRLLPSRHNKIKRAFKDAGQSLIKLLFKPHRLAMALVSSMGITVCSIGAFALTLKAVGLDVDLATTIIAFTAGVAAIAISPTPNGLGATEVAMTFVLTNSGVDNELALSAVLLFRIISFWLPILPGYLAFRHISAKGWV